MTRVLIVDDSPTQAEELRYVLESEGFEADIAADGPGALSRLASGRYDLVISDIVMPAMSGYELCRAIKSDRSRRDLPVILLTTLSDPMDIIQGLECGADNFLTKPYEPDYLISRVRCMLENKRMRAGGKLSVGVEIFFLGRKFTVTSDKEQILDLLISTFEDIVRNSLDLQQSKLELAAAKLKIEDYARRLEGEVRVSEQRYSALMEHANDAILIADEQGKIAHVNRRAEELLGTPADTIVGRTFPDLVIPGERDRTAAQFRRLRDDGRAQWRDVQLARPGAAPGCADVSASLVHTDGSSSVMFIARDMTEANRLRQQVLHNEKLATVGTLAAGIAHEINNPTAVILGNLSCIAEHVGGAGSDMSPEDLQEALRDSMHAAERVRDIVRDLKGFSHLDEGDVGLVDVHERIDTSLRMAANEVRYRARIEKRYAPGLPRILASAGRLNQLFLNILVNAAQAIEEGRVEQNVIVISTRALGASICVEISDTGKGIPPEIVPRIFDPFFTTKPVGVGTGLGLSICHDIVKKHGGEISVKSEVGRGTTFTLVLPREGRLAPPRGSIAREAPRVERLKILVVDDDASLLRVYSRMVGRHHDVVSAQGGRAALEVIASQGAGFDAILCDMMMPDVDGVDLYMHLAKEHPGLEHRMVFLTGGAFTARATEFLERAQSPRLEKPFLIEDVLRAVAAMLAKRRS
jgi:two-component system, cell cycle sensor histidine kinase and response regulator CckA